MKLTSDGELKMAGCDPLHLEILGGVTSQLEDLSSEVLHDGGQIDGGTSTNTGGVVSLAEETVNTSNGELETSTAGPGLGLGLNFSTFTTSGHFDCLMFGYKLMAAVSGAGFISPPPTQGGCWSHRAGARAVCGVTRLSRKTV